jgi:hypothetical protein
MTAIINKFKSINKEWAVILVVAFVSYRFHSNSLITIDYFYIVILGISLCVFLFLFFVLIRYKIKSKIIFFAKTALYVYFIAFLTLFIAGNYCQEKVVITQLRNVSYTRYGTQITFRINDKSFSRQLFLKKYCSITNPNLTKEYDVILHLKEPIKHIYIIDAIGLVLKRERG